MFDQRSDSLTELLIQAEIIKKEDREIYKFGIQQGLTSLLNIITTLTIGVIFHAFWQSVVFIIAYIPLRHFAGGYHAKTPIRCYILSIALISILLLAISFLRVPNYANYAMLITASIVILLLSPLGATAKPLEPLEIKVYKQRTAVIWFVEFIIIMIMFMLHKNQLASCMIWVLVFSALMLIIEKVRLLFSAINIKDSVLSIFKKEYKD